MPVLEEKKSLVEEALDRSLPPETAWPQTLHRAVRYSLFAGGKRVRPVLALSAAEAVGGDPAAALEFACAVEMVHTFSLIHDDLPAMDDDDLRRGQPTSHKVFGEAIAILAGDALLARAFELLAHAAVETPESQRRLVRASSLLGEAVGSAGLIGGQVEDLESEGQEVSGDVLERIHRAKTSALLRASVVGGAILGGASERQLGPLEAYGAAIGLAFQVVDDILDATESASRLGKTAGKDRAARKATYVRIHGLESAKRKAGELLALALRAIEPLGERAERLADLARFIVERRA